MIEIGQYKHDPHLGVIEIKGIDYDKSNNPFIIDVKHRNGSSRIMLRFANNMRDATDEEIQSFLSEKQHVLTSSGNDVQKSYSIFEEIPEIQEVFDEIVFAETMKFINEHPSLQIQLFGADTNIFYSDYILSIHTSNGLNIENISHLDKWDYYNFANYLNDNEKYKYLKVRLQPILFGEDQYEVITDTNSDSIIKEVQEIFIRSVLRTKNRITQLENAKIVIVDHDQSAENANKLVEEISAKQIRDIT